MTSFQLYFREYLSSKKWKRQRQRSIGFYGGKMCFICAKNKIKPQIHHLTYKHLFNEPPKDLVPLCVKCHSAVHKLVKEKKMSILDATLHLKSIERKKRRKNKQFTKLDRADGMRNYWTSLRKEKERERGW